MNMRNVLLLAALAIVPLFQTGCAHSDPARFYLLAPTVAPGASESASNVGLRVDPLPDYLRRPELATRTSPHEVSYDEFSRWAEPLDRSLPEVLATNLARALGQPMVPVYPFSLSRQPERIIHVRIERFDADADGTVTLAACFCVQDTWAQETFTVKATSPTPDAIVAAQCQALGRLAQRLAGR
jgi:uncharacterized lipoprotein YmbA